MTVNVVLIIVIAWSLMGLVPIVKWRFAGTRRLRHVDGSRGFLRDVYLANAPILPLLPVVATLSALAAADVINGDVAWVSMIAMGMIVTFGMNVPLVKNASIRLLRTRYPDESMAELEARV